MEEFYYEESNSKNVFFKCLVILFVIGVCIGLFLYYKNEHTIKLKNVRVEVGSELSRDVNDYLVSGEKFSDDYKLVLDEVDVNHVGEYSYKVKYNKHSKSGKVNVVDTKSPEVVISDITVGVGEKFSYDNLIVSCTDFSLPCRVSLKRDSDVDKFNSVGVYDIPIVISDSVGNTTLKNVSITVSDSESMSSLQSNDLNYYTNSKDDDKIEHVLFHKLDKAISEETLEYEGLIQEISSIDFNEYISDGKELYDVELITAYNRYGYVIGIQVLVTYVDGNKKLLGE